MCVAICSYTRPVSLIVMMLVALFVVTVSQNVVDEVKRIIVDSEITREDDHSWPEPDRVGRQELEVKMGSEHIHFTVSKAVSKFLIS